MKPNPFRARQLYPGRIPYLFPPGVVASDLIQKFHDNSCQGQIVGPHGSGKSTLLFMLAEEFRRRDYQVLTVRLAPSNRKLPPIVGPDLPQCVLIVDGCEQASWWARRSFVRHSHQLGWGLLVSSHRSLGLPTLWETSVTHETARRIVDALTHFDKPPTADETVNQELTVPPALISELLDKNQGDMREVLFSLYDWFQRQES